MDKRHHLDRADLWAELIEPAQCDCKVSYPGIAVDVPYLSPECIASNSMGDRILTKYEIMTIDTGYYSLPDLDNYGHSKYLLLP